MAYWIKIFRDFDHCYKAETGKTKHCKDCDKHQQQLCECEANLTDNKPVKLEKAS